MDNRKIYRYYTLTPLDALDSVEWTRENYLRYDGNASPLWNDYVLEEFARLNKEHTLRNEIWEDTFKAIANDIDFSKHLKIEEN